MRPRKRLDVVDLVVPLRRYARALTRDPTQADDLVHDALVRALEHQGSLRGGTNLRTWLMTVLHNAFIDGQRRRQVEARYADSLGHLADEAVPPAQDSHVRLAQIREAFGRLPEEQRAALHLVTIEGLAYQEAADVLGIPIGTLMSRLGRARAALRSFENRAPALPAPAPSPPRLRVVQGGGRAEDNP
ncbi:sigma-70 family RNA polymerase sigma factor [Methylobacterium isbiliense]|jgi:RNA polymerase sigma-70 factor (ECF subfamily)|uniref:ECF RNA polymerase sigma factor EcfG n=1 Tax=Methylobacterium isbiliense TaxID=315478 RepID=A0ABQ4SFN2_9HYPH|nr:sigma-70 family RNA polymerase sigma factor [Methylobacterium isbiliense]MDN3627460.1 sigma-70 family RNA polymerase sigma factor [Methylobacterium isbiliense]GJE01213.1 ECF RNA polymerase sigma factor EcfG [Methylobacterium isbiliense]